MNINVDAYTVIHSQSWVFKQWAPLYLLLPEREVWVVSTNAVFPCKHYPQMPKKKQHRDVVGGREERNWKGFHMVTVAIGTIYQLPKVSVSKKVRSTKKKNQRSKRKICVCARKHHAHNPATIWCKHIERRYFLRKGSGGRHPKCCDHFSFKEQVGGNVLNSGEVLDGCCVISDSSVPLHQSVLCLIIYFACGSPFLLL